MCTPQLIVLWYFNILDPTHKLYYRRTETFYMGFDKIPFFTFIYTSICPQLRINQRKVEFSNDL